MSMNNILNSGIDTSKIVLNEKDQNFMSRLDKKLQDGLINQSDYETSKSALYSKYKNVQNTKVEEKKVETKKVEEKKEVKVEEKKVEEKKVEQKVEEKKVEQKVEEKKVEEKKVEEKKVEQKVEEKKVEEKKVEEKKVEQKVEENKVEQKVETVTTNVSSEGVNEYWTKEKMENATPMGLETEDLPPLEDQLPNLESQGQEGQEGDNVEGNESSHSRAEKKARKAFSKLGLKTFPGVRKVTIKQSQLLFTIAKPEVFKLGNSYVIFGKVQIKDNAGKKGIEETLKEGLSKKTSNDDEIPTLEEAEKLDEIIMDGEKKDIQVEDKDIELIQKSVPNATKEEMIKSYKDNEGDVVAAIMELKK